MSRPPRAAKPAHPAPPRKDPVRYFIVRSTGTAHIVRRTSRYEWDDGTAYIGVQYACHNIGVAPKTGTLTSQVRNASIICARCLGRGLTRDSAKRAATRMAKAH